MQDSENLFPQLGFEELCYPTSGTEVVRRGMCLREGLWWEPEPAEGKVLCSILALSSWMIVGRPPEPASLATKC